jgi:hypothetical protein
MCHHHPKEVKGGKPERGKACRQKISPHQSGQADAMSAWEYQAVIRAGMKKTTRFSLQRGWKQPIDYTLSLRCLS